MKASQLHEIESSWEAFKHDAELHRRVCEALANPEANEEFDITLDNRKLLEGAFGEPREYELYLKMRTAILMLAKSYLEKSLDSIRQELRELGLEVDV
ncbi:MAG: hypothetical protein ABL901_15165 [Hyphomicrobiaceae bacterium]